MSEKQYKVLRYDKYTDTHMIREWADNRCVGESLFVDLFVDGGIHCSERDNLIGKVVSIGGMSPFMYTAYDVALTKSE